jgi:hypothetical protein
MALLGVDEQFLDALAGHGPAQLALDEAWTSSAGRVQGEQCTRPSRSSLTCSMSCALTPNMPVA